MNTASTVTNSSTALRVFVRAFFHILAFLLLRVRVRGLKHEYLQTSYSAGNKKKLLVIANHQSFLDGVLLGLFLPMKDPVFVVHTEIVKSPLMRFCLGVVADYLAIDTSNPIAIKQVYRLLNSGRPVVIFPEGRITVTGSLMKVYEGPAYLAAKAAAHVLPVHIEGTVHSIFARAKKVKPRRLFPRITLTVLPPQLLPMPEGASAKVRRNKAGENMRKLMQVMALNRPCNDNIYGEFLDAIALYGRRTPILEDIKLTPYSYKDMLKMTLMLGRVIGRNCSVGENVGVLLPNMAPTMGVFLGLVARRRVPAMLNYTVGADGLQTACTAAQIRLIVTSRAFVEQAKLQSKIEALEGSTRLFYLEDLAEHITTADKLWLVLWALRVPRLFQIRSKPSDPAVVLFTSGSESKPKGVVLSHKAILSNIAQIRSVIDVTSEDRMLNVLPIFHSFGLTGGTLWPLLSGYGVFLYPTPLHYRIIPEIAYDRNCTILLGTSTFLAQYGRLANPYDFYRLRFVVSGAEPLAPAVRQLWSDKFGLRIMEGFGTTETAPVLAVNTPLAFRQGTVGQFLPGVEYQLQTIPGISPGALLHVRCPNLMNGYLRAENPGIVEPPQSDNGPGWYDTGDMIEVDGDGFLRIVGRLKRFAKIAGEMISLETVEKIAHSAAPEAQHAASCQPSAVKGEALVLFTTSDKLDRPSLTQAVQRLGLAELAVPRKIVHLAQLPLLASGKTDYVTLKRMALEA